MEKIDISDGHMNNLFIYVGYEIFNHTGQLFEAKGDYVFKPLGSCVLIKIKEKYFICTASHVLNIIDKGQTIYINTILGMMPLYGKVIKSRLDMDETIDIGYIVIDYKLVTILSSTFSFLQEKQIHTSNVSGDTSQFVTVGFPEKNIIEDDSNMKSFGSFFQHKLASKKIYDHYKLNPDINYIVEHSGKGNNIFTNEKQRIEPESYGMSGCGLWFLNFYKSEFNGKIMVQYFLIGIMTDFKKYRYHVLIGSNISLLTNLILEEENLRENING